MPMEVPHEQVLRKMRVRLVEKLELQRVLDYLKGEDVFYSEDYSKINGKEHLQDQIREFLDILDKRDVKTYEHFKDALRKTKAEHLAIELEDKERELQQKQKIPVQEVCKKGRTKSHNVSEPVEETRSRNASEPDEDTKHQYASGCVDEQKLPKVTELTKLFEAKHNQTYKKKICEKKLFVTTQQTQSPADVKAHQAPKSHCPTQQAYQLPEKQMSVDAAPSCHQQPMPLSEFGKSPLSPNEYAVNPPSYSASLSLDFQNQCSPLQLQGRSQAAIGFEDFQNQCSPVVTTETNVGCVYPPIYSHPSHGNGEQLVSLDTLYVPQPSMPDHTMYQDQ